MSMHYANASRKKRARSRSAVSQDGRGRAAGQDNSSETAIERVRALRQPVPSESLQALEPVAQARRSGHRQQYVHQCDIHSVKATEEGLAKVILTRSHYGLLQASRPWRPLTNSEIKEVFDSFDTDNSGTLDKAEFTFARRASVSC